MTDFRQTGDHYYEWKVFNKDYVVAFCHQPQHTCVISVPAATSTEKKSSIPDVEITDVEHIEVLDALFSNGEKGISYDDVLAIRGGKHTEDRQRLYEFMNGLKSACSDIRMWKTVPRLQHRNDRRGAYILLGKARRQPGKFDQTNIRKNLFTDALSGELSIQPILHTLTLVKRKGTNQFREIGYQDEKRPDECFVNDLTGWGDAQALIEVDRYIRQLDTTIRVEIPKQASRYSQAWIDDSSRPIFWLGSPFNHNLTDELLTADLWDYKTECSFRHLPNGGVRVHWPGGNKTVNLGSEKHTVQYALVRHVKRRSGKHTSLLIAAGTDTEATLFASQVLTSVDKDKERYLKEAMSVNCGSHNQHQFEALFKRSTRRKEGEVQPMTTLLWPKRVDF
jgi:hypothetical protein